ncbi:DNA polymerase III subunit delta' [bacterium]|nr:DNA polymerase III subunit delta' [bacterium]MBT4648716.1 DNA polymerase III subunit delta' [bacterium]
MSVDFSWPIYGHQQQINFLQESIRQDKLANTYLFYGPRGLGKKLVAYNFAKSLFCQAEDNKPCKKCDACRQIDKGVFADLHILGKTQDELSAESVKGFLARLSLTTSYGGHKLAIIQKVESINLFSANALLKILEEPPKNTTIILVADQIHSLPATIISRCQLLKFRSLDKESIQEWLKSFDLTEIEKATISNLSFGKPGLALEYMEDKLDNFKEKCEFLLKLLDNDTLSALQSLDHWFTALKKEYPSYKIYELGEQTKQYLHLLELILRDILWLKLGRQPINTIFEEQLTLLAKQYQPGILLKNLLNINKIKKQLKQNVSPLTLWENLVLDFKS